MPNRTTYVWVVTTYEDYPTIGNVTYCSNVTKAQDIADGSIRGRYANHSNRHTMLLGTRWDWYPYPPKHGERYTSCVIHGRDGTLASIERKEVV